MTIETLLQLDPRIWPIAVMMFLRIVGIVVWLPLLGEAVIPMRLKIVFCLCLSLFMWPVVSAPLLGQKFVMDWNTGTLLLTTIREVFFGFAIGFSARMIIYGVNIASNLVGLNMGFQSASLFNPALEKEESAFTAFQGWLVLVILLALNLHHIFIEGIAKSFSVVPLAPIGQSGAISHMGMQIVESMFVMAIKLAAPLLVVQTLVTVALGLMNRAIPQLNVFVVSFPVSFLVSMMVIFFTAGTFVRFIATSFAHREVAGIEAMQRAFKPSGDK